MDDDRARTLCANTCKHATCTGRGDTSKWAHRCQLRPDLLPELAPVFTRHESPPPILASPGLTVHEYGPHDPGTVPATVTVLGGGKWPRPEERPRPAALVLQRAAVNRRAASCD